LIQKKQKIKADEKQQPFPSHSRGKIKALLKPIAQFSLLHYIYIFFLLPIILLLHSCCCFSKAIAQLLKNHVNFLPQMHNRLKSIEECTVEARA
jgi:hypothetical protein